MLLCVGALAGNPSGLAAAAVAERPAATLRQADSLFARGRYAAAAAAYRAQVWRARRASPQLLLRLAYAAHARGADAYPSELLYLSLLYARQPRLRTWRRLAELAAQHRLVGYPTTWQQELRVQFRRYYHPGLQALLAVAVNGGVWLLLRRRRGRRRGRGWWLAYGAYLLGVGAYLHWLRPAPAALVARPGAVLMAGPSAGAPYLNAAAVGDRLLVLGRRDIWCRVRWQEREAYIRAADVLVVE